MIGGWQLSGVGRWTSGLPFSVISGAGWGTNWLEKSNMVQTGAIQTGTRHRTEWRSASLRRSRAGTGQFAKPVPGEAGERNNFRGDGYFGLDARLAKTWKLSERTGMQFAWDVYNVTNSVRFDVNPLNSLQNPLPAVLSVSTTLLSPLHGCSSFLYVCRFRILDFPGTCPRIAS